MNSATSHIRRGLRPTWDFSKSRVLFPGMQYCLIGTQPRMSWGGWEGMTQASGQEPRKPMEKPGREWLPVERTALPFSTPEGLKVEAMASRLYWKAQIGPRRELCVGKEWDSKSDLHREDVGPSGCFKKNTYSGGCNGKQGSGPKISWSVSHLRHPE